MSGATNPKGKAWSDVHECVMRNLACAHARVNVRFIMMLGNAKVVSFVPVLSATRRVDHAAEKRSVRRDVLTQVQYESTQTEKTRGHLEVPKTTHRQSLRPERQKS